MCGGGWCGGGAACCVNRDAAGVTLCIYVVFALRVKPKRPSLLRLKVQWTFNASEDVRALRPRECCSLG